MSNTSLLGSFGGQAGDALMFRNVLINGCFRVWQRGTSQTSAGYGSADRWVFGHSGSSRTASRQTFTVGQTDVPGNPTYFVRNVVTSVAGNSNYTLMRQNIEYVSTLAGQTVTVSFWAKADGAKPISIEFTQSFGTGGSPVVVGTGTKITLSTSWAYYSIVVNLPSISGKTIGPDDYLQMNIWLEAGSDFNARTNSLGQQSGTFDFSNFQLEAGPTATPFERRPIGTELALCQRYYEIIGSGYAHTGTASVMYLVPKMQVLKRKTIVTADVTISASTGMFINAANYSSASTTIQSVVVYGNDIGYIDVRGYSGLPVPGNGFFNGGTVAISAEL